MKTLNLNGWWDFIYTREEYRQPADIPAPAAFQVKMPVPGYWDDHLEELKYTAVWSREVSFNPDFRQLQYPLGTGKPADASLPYLVGSGWYRRVLTLVRPAPGELVYFRAGEAVLAFRLFVNRQEVFYRDCQLAPEQVEIGNWLKDGDNEIILLVSNQHRQVISAALRGYKGFSGGIYGQMSMHFCRQARIISAHAWPQQDLHTVNTSVMLKQSEAKTLRVNWQLRDQTGRVLAETQQEGSKPEITGSFLVAGLTAWTPENPVLYQLTVTLYQGQRLLDQKTQVYGHRQLTVRGHQILLNNCPIWLRGLTEHAYYPQTCTPPLDKNSYRSMVRACRAIGFNWIRFHTAIPHEYYLEACDELGMLVQVEMPNGFTDELWEPVVLKCRRHPSVILYCGGNEERLTDKMIKRLEEGAKICKTRAPEVLFSPMQSLPGVDWLLEAGAPLKERPFPHNPEKLRWLQQFSDVFQPQKNIGFNVLESNWQEINEQLSGYEKPYLSHEAGILDSYLNLDLAHRYRQTRIGTALYEGAEKNLEAAGLLANAPVYYRNSCRWSAVLRKFFIEKLRLCSRVSGYDYLGAIDCHWHRSGYSPGILNEFYEHKPGETVRDILQYNGESVILADLPLERNYYAGDELKFAVYASIYGRHQITAGNLLVWLEDACAQAAGGWKITAGPVQTGRNALLGELAFKLPAVEYGQKFRLRLFFDSRSYHLENEYSLWIYPRKELAAGTVEVCRRPDETVFERINQGAQVLILHPFGLKTMPLDFCKMLAGRTIGNTATVFWDHPALAEFPHEGWGDWQCHALFEDAAGVVFDDQSPLPFAPIVEVVSSYKIVFKQASVFEFALGQGRALVCTLNIQGEHPAKKAFFRSLLNYMNGPHFAPAHQLTLAAARQFFDQGGRLPLDYSQDTGFDANAKRNEG